MLIFLWRLSLRLSVWEMIWCMDDPAPLTWNLPGVPVLFWSLPEITSLLIPKVKSLLFLTESGILPFLILLTWPLLMIIIIWAWDSRSLNFNLEVTAEPDNYSEDMLPYGFFDKAIRLWVLRPMLWAILYWLSTESKGSIFLRFSSEKPQNSR